MPLEATPSKMYVYPGNTQMITVEGLQDLSQLPALVFLNAASLTATLVDDDGNQIQGCIGIPLTYVLGSNGNYIGTFGDNTFQPGIGTGYTLIVEGSQSGGWIHEELIVEVKPRNT
jgi:hypothetical protein